MNLEKTLEARSLFENNCDARKAVLDFTDSSTGTAFSYDTHRYYTWCTNSIYRNVTVYSCRRKIQSFPRTISKHQHSEPVQHKLHHS